MKYTITITAEEVESVWMGREWKQKADGTEGYDYTPTVEHKRAVTREVLKQQVDELDLAAVIRAINKL